MGGLEAFGVEIESAEVEVDGVAEVLSISVAGCHSLDPLDLAVDALCTCVRHVRGGRVDHALPEILDHPSDSLDGFES